MTTELQYAPICTLTDPDRDFWASGSGSGLGFLFKIFSGYDRSFLITEKVLFNWIFVIPSRKVLILWSVIIECAYYFGQPISLAS